MQTNHHSRCPEWLGYSRVVELDAKMLCDFGHIDSFLRSQFPQVRMDGSGGMDEWCEDFLTKSLVLLSWHFSIYRNVQHAFPPPPWKCCWQAQCSQRSAARLVCSWEEAELKAQKVITQSPVCRRRVCMRACICVCTRVCVLTHGFIVHIYMCKV